MARLNRLEEQVNGLPRLIVQLTNFSSTEPNNSESERSGLMNISAITQPRRIYRKLREDLQIWLPMMFNAFQARDTLSQPIKIKSFPRDEVKEFLDFIQGHVDREIIVILPGQRLRSIRVLSKLRGLRQVIHIYRCLPNRAFDNGRLGCQSFCLKLLPRKLFGNPVDDLDRPSRLALMEISLTELIGTMPNSEETRREFIDYYHSYYQRNTSVLQSFNTLMETYRPENAIRFYTNPQICIYRLVGHTLASLDLVALFQIRFILHDLYVQLHRLHEEQCSTLLNRDLRVYRGITLTQTEIDVLKKVGELFITRNFLPTTVNEWVAAIFAGEGQSGEDGRIGVVLEMALEKSQLQEKPVAFIQNLSQIPAEEEVLVSTGIALRTASVEEIMTDMGSVTKIRFVRGKEEKQIEQDLSWHIECHSSTLSIDAEPLRPSNDPEETSETHEDVLANEKNPFFENTKNSHLFNLLADFLRYEWVLPLAFRIILFILCLGLVLYLPIFLIYSKFICLSSPRVKSLFF